MIITSFVTYQVSYDNFLNAAKHSRYENEQKIVLDEIKIVIEKTRDLQEIHVFKTGDEEVLAEEYRTRYKELQNGFSHIIATIGFQKYLQSGLIHST